MLMAIIEFELNPGVEDEFNALSASLLPELEKIDGFLSADPAASLGREGQFYEISYWRDQAALAQWSAHADHLVAKALGRDKVLKWYRIRVGEVKRDWTAGPAPTN